MKTTGLSDRIRPTTELPVWPAAMIKAAPKQGASAANPGK